MSNSAAITVSHHKLVAEAFSVALPATGIEYPFLKKRPVFIRDAPSFEPLWENKK